MQRPESVKGGWRGIVIGLLCGLVLGFLLTLLPSLLLLYPFVIVAGTILLMTLELKFGNAGFMTASLAAILLGSLVLSPLMGILFLLMISLPAFIAAYMIRSRKPFVKLIMTGTIASLLGQVLALLLYQVLVGSNPIKDFVDALVAAVRDVMPASMLEPYGPILTALLERGYLPVPEGYIAGQTLTGETLKEVFCGMLSLLEEAYAGQAPAAMLSSALYAGIPGIYLAVHMAFGKQAERRAGISLPGHSMLRIPPSLTFLLLAATAILFVLYLTKVVSYIIFNAVWTGIVVLYALQGVSVMCFFLEKKKVPFVWQAVLGIVGLVLLRILFFLLGLVEQSFYLRGIGRPTVILMRPDGRDDTDGDDRDRDHEDHDDDEPEE